MPWPIFANLLNFLNLLNEQKKNLFRFKLKGGLNA